MKRWLNDTSIIVGIAAFFILAHFIFPLKKLAAISDDFNKIAIGLAALVTAYFGSTYFRDELFRKRAIKQYSSMYPPDKHGHSFKIIESDKTHGAIFLLDLQTKKKHHIWNMKTMYDLGWQTFLPAEVIKDDVFQKISTGEAIRTRGELGE